MTICRDIFGFWDILTQLNGEQGVTDVLRNLLADLDLTLGLAGYASLGTKRFSRARRAKW